MNKLGNYIEQIRGVSYKPEDCSEHKNNGYIPLLRANNIKDGKINYDNLVYVKEEKIKEEQYLKKGDILICTSNGSKELVGKAGLIKEDVKASFGAFCRVIRIKKDLSYRYLIHFFQSNYYREMIKKKSNGANINNLKNDDIDSLNLTILKEEEQYKIANILDKIVDIINIKEKQLIELDELIKAQFAKMFENKSFPKITGKDLFVFSSGKGLEQSKRKKNGVPVYGGNGIAWYTDEPLINFDTIIIGRVGAYCGNVNIVEEPVWITDNAIYIKKFLKDLFEIKFLYYLMHSIDFSKYAQRSGQPKITQEPLKNYNYIIPPKEEQLKFSSIAKQLEKQKGNCEKLIELLNNLKDSKMQEYFGGVINE